jgi:Polyketide cyclase / dehydrase and lipid transport
LPSSTRATSRGRNASHRIVRDFDTNGLCTDRLAGAPSATASPRRSGGRDAGVGGDRGTPRNGLGIVSFKPALWSTIHERITRFEPPESFDYVLFKGMPALRSHLGTVSVDDLGRDRSRLNWNVDFVFRTVHPFTLFLPSFLRQFEEVLKAGVENLRRQLESGIEHAHH